MRYLSTCRAPWCCVVLTVLMAAAGAGAQTVQPPYDNDYHVVDLGAVPELPSPNGGLAFLPGDPDVLVIGGEANDPSGMLYRARVTRDADGHINGFSGTASIYADGAFNDGGVSFMSSGVLFISRYPTNELGQISPGGTTITRVVDLAALGVAESPGGLNFVPTGFPGEGSLKLASWGDGGFYTLQLDPMEAGTHNVSAATRETSITGGPEGFVYVPVGSPRFADGSEMLVSDWSDHSISVYTIDDGGNPIPNTRRTFVSDVTGPEGAAIDPLTGDFLFSTFAPGNDRLLVIRGFAAPPNEDPPDEPAQCTDPQPKGPGYWHRQCLGTDPAAGGLQPGRGHGPKQPIRPDFTDGLMPGADARLAALGFSGVSTCEGMQPEPPSDRCQQAQRALTTLVLNVGAELLSDRCEVALAHRGCTATTVGDLIEETARLIGGGNCNRAIVCLHGVHER